MEEVKLKNGSEEAIVLVNSIYIIIEKIMRFHPMAFYDIVKKCRDNSYNYFGNNEKIIQEYGLIQDDGSIHNSIKNVILSEVTGDELNMSLVSPVLDE